MTLTEAKLLQSGDYVHHTSKKNADGTPMRAKVTSVKTWIKQPQRVLIGVKHGLRDYAKFDETELDQLAKGSGY